MAFRLDVTVHDVQGQPLRPRSVDLAGSPLPPVASGYYSGPIAPGVSTLTISFEANSDLWDISQSMELVARGDAPPELRFTNSPGPARHVAISSPPHAYSPGPGDWSITLVVTAGRFRDASARVAALESFAIPLVTPAASITAPGPTLVTPAASITAPGPTDLLFADLPPCIDAASGWIKVATPRATHQPQGWLLIAEQRIVPKLVFIWLPASVTLRSWDPSDLYDHTREQLKFHLYFLPPVPDRAVAAATHPFPFDFEYTHIAHRYLLYGDPRQPSPVRAGNGLDKCILYQHSLASVSALLVLPVGAPARRGPGDYSSQPGAHRLLLEAGYWTQRMREIDGPRHGIGRVALSGFSAGCRFMRHALETDHGADPAFFDQVKEAYFFDGAAHEAGAFTRWYTAGGGDPRMLRVYTQHAAWNNLEAEIRRRGGVAVHGANGVLEVQNATGSLVVVPPAAWSAHGIGGGEAHQLISALFVFAALSMSRL